MDFLRQTWINLAANKTRSFLTMFGIAWGLISLILMTSMNKGMIVAQQQKARALGQNIMIVWGGMTSKGNQGIRSGKYIRLMLDDYITLKQKAKYLQRLSPEIQRYLPARSNINNGMFNTHGVFPDYMQMRTINIATGGRLINDGDNTNALRVCIIGNEVKDQLFKKENTVGQSIMIGGFPYLVIGELIKKDQNSNYSGPDGKKIFIPFYTISRDFPLPTAVKGKFELSDMILQPRDDVTGEAAELQARKILAAEKRFDYLDKEALPIWNTITQAKYMKKLFDSMQLFLGSVAIVTLILGGVGVMNIMLFCVQERTHEIGVLKAIGARRRHIRLQFLCEAMALSIIGGVLGYILAILIAHWIGAIPFLGLLFDDNSGQGDIHLIVNTRVFFTSFITFTLIGLISGTWPAIKASRLDPVASLRSE
jgi:putative ABC transport system permease protein